MWTVLDTHGAIGDAALSLPSHCSRLRLRAATTLLELATTSKFDAVITDALYFQLALMMQVGRVASRRTARRAG